MSANSDYYPKTRTGSDAIIDGLVAGLIAGLIMGALLVLGMAILGESPATLLSRFNPGANPSPLLGGLIHLSISGFYGMIFGWLAYIFVRKANIKTPPSLLGLVYGLLLFLIGEWVVLPGTGSTLMAIPAWLFGIVHLLFGLILGWQIGRKWQD